MEGQGWSNGGYQEMIGHPDRQQSLAYGQPQLQHQHQYLPQQQSPIGPFGMTNRQHSQDLVDLSTMAAMSSMNSMSNMSDGDWSAFNDMPSHTGWNLPVTGASYPPNLDGPGDMAPPSSYDIVPASQQLHNPLNSPHTEGASDSNSPASPTRSESYLSPLSKERKDSLAIPQGLGKSLLPRPSISLPKRTRSATEITDDEEINATPVQSLGPTSARHSIPARPKPGRKPALDKPTEKRKEQNRAAQRAFRTRKSEIVDELHDDIRKLKAELQTLAGEYQRLRADYDSLKKQTGKLSKDYNTAQSVCEEKDRTVAALRRELAEQVELYRVQQVTHSAAAVGGFDALLMQQSEQVLASAQHVYGQQHGGQMEHAAAAMADEDFNFEAYQ